ncbi:secretin N-terminal domain-containing protein [uncultured Desulfovibrio sp.]|uniref:secretin N-terminal domain-containing protein n=1 Tax=uncultured Desulfovibrio sp. TaxID=167968 RepID=UPI00272D68C8|nr:secretin N-terminal domain-containing protein [uncultured Desulfovibrio sp.]
MRNNPFFRNIAFLFLGVILFGCAHKGAPDQELIENKGRDFTTLSRSRAVDVVAEPYVGVKAVPIRADEQSQAALNTHVTLRKRGTLGVIAASIADLTPLTVQVGADPAPLTGGQKKSGGQSGNPDLPDLLDVPGSGPSRLLQISYEGPLRGLLDNVAIASGYGWDFDARTNTVVFSRLSVRTFTILGAPGKREYKDNITNKSRESTRSSIGGSNVNATVASSDTSSQTAQANTTDYKFDIWADTEKAVKALLSPEGSVVGNQAAGTITVRDRAENIRQVSAYIAEINRRLSRQVALTVHVWALEVTDENEAGLDFQMLFANDDISIVAGSLASLGSPSSASATIVSGKLKNSTGVLKALKEWGNATQVTSGGGLILSNQPVPIQAIKRIAYLAGSSSSQSDYGQTTEITPGEVTTGFAMTIIPHILDRRRVLLQYSINLSSLDELTEFSTSDLTIQLPKTSTRAFSQRSTMQMGQTLVLAGFQDQTQQLANSLGLLNFGRGARYGKTLLVITIEVEAAGGGTED